MSHEPAIRILQQFVTIAEWNLKRYETDEPWEGYVEETIPHKESLEGSIVALRSDLADYIERQRAWSLDTFGNGPRTEGLCKHIEKELAEIRANPRDLAEWIDVVILALDGAWRAGYSPSDIIAELHAKQLINFGRTWPENTSQGRPAEHVKEAANVHA